MTLIQRALSNSGCIRNSIKNRIKNSLSDNRFRTLTIKQKMQDSFRQGMQESFYETANAGVSLSDSGCRSLSDSRCIRYSIRKELQESFFYIRHRMQDFLLQRMQEPFHQKHLRYRGCRSFSFYKQMQKSLFHTADVGFTLSNIRCRTPIRQQMQYSLYQTADAGVIL